jgi:DNA/RNA-binding domain of Phe-tRNA-synthetase-like protein
MEIRIELPGVRLGLVEADGVRVEPGDPALVREMSEACERLRRILTLDAASELESVRAVRAMFRGWGIDPARYRPSSEALLRRVVQGKGLYRVSNVVDANNLGSIETGWPYGSYNRAALALPLCLRAGHPGEAYEGIGKQTWHVAGRPVLADSSGPFGSPISDSTRTMVTFTTQDILSVVFVPEAASDAALLQALERHARRLARSAQAAATRTSILPQVSPDSVV